MDSTAEIADEFGELSPAERYETTASFLSQFAETMRDNNKRIFSRVLDMIAATKGNEKLHLDMLATHIEMESWVDVEVKTWDVPEITSLSEYRAWSHLGDDSGICAPIKEPDGYVVRYLSSLEVAVRKNASRDLLGTLADSLELPAEFYEFLKHTSGAVYPNLDRQMFVCTFAAVQHGEQEQAEPLDKICQFAGCDGFEVAAGWKTGDNESCYIYYLLCKDADELDEPWQWRIFINNTEFHDGGYFDSLHEFLGWYCSAYDWVEWKAVQDGINSLHRRCKEALEKDQEEN